MGKSLISQMLTAVLAPAASSLPTLAVLQQLIAAPRDHFADEVQFARRLEGGR